MNFDEYNKWKREGVDIVLSMAEDWETSKNFHLGFQTAEGKEAIEKLKKKYANAGEAQEEINKEVFFLELLRRCGPPEWAIAAMIEDLLTQPPN